MERTMRPLSRQLRHSCCRSSPLPLPSTRRTASTEVEQDVARDLATQSSIGVGSSHVAPDDFDPLGPSLKRREPLPASRYQYRPPKYNRGPLHPHQSPPASDPASREFVPGPFSTPRLRETYESRIAPDLMTMSYTHYPPGYEAPKKAERLRRWVGDSPYFKNRPLRGPRGDSVLRYIKKPITFRNIPQLERITIHSQVDASEGTATRHVAAMVLQAMTGAKCEGHRAKRSVNEWKLKAGDWVSLTCHLKGEDMYHFLAKCVDVVMPRIKDWQGIRGSSGDSSGNITMGLTPEQVALFPEVEVNYDAYPPKMIPGCHITFLTSARNDRDARILLNACGIPFYGKLVN